MAKNCIFQHFDKDGNLSESYKSNVAKYGEETAHKLFISDALKTDTLIRKSIDINNDEKLRTKYSAENLSKEGYIGPTKIISSVKDPNLTQRIYAAMAVDIKVREELITQKRKLGESVTPDNFIFLDKNENYKNTLKAVKEKYFIDPKTFDVKPEYKGEFDALKVDAKALVDLQINKGNQQHELLKQIFIAKSDAFKKGKTYFDDYFNTALETYKEKTGKDNIMNAGMIESMKFIAEDLVKQADHYGQTWKVNDIEMMPEVSIFTDKLKYKGSPLQGHIDLLLYSPSTKQAVIFDYKTKSDKSFANYERGWKRMSYPFNDLSQSAENTTAIQTGTYSLILNKEYGINVMANKAVLITSRYSDGNILEAKTDGKRDWKISKIDHTKTEVVDLPEVKGLLSDVSIFDIKDSIGLGEKSADNLIHDLFDGKLSTTVSSKINFVNGHEPNIKDLGNGLYKWFNSSDPSQSVVRSTREEVREGIGNWYDEYTEIKKKAAGDLVHFFNHNSFPDKSIWESEKYKQRAVALLQQFTPEVYALESTAEVPGLGKDIIIAKNKLTGESTLMSIAVLYNNDYSFGESKDDSAKTTIFGKIIDDSTVFKKYGKENIPAADVHSLTHLRLAMVAAELKIKNPKKYSGIHNILSTSLSDNSPYSYSNITTQMGFLKEMVKLMKANNKPVPAELNMIVENPELSGKDAFKVDYFASFMKSFSEGNDPLKLLRDNDPSINKYKTDKLRDRIRESIAKLQQDKFNYEAYDKIEKDLSKYVQSVFGALLTKDRTIQGVYEDPMFVAANRAWLSFKGWMVIDNPNLKGDVLSQFNSLTSIGEANAENVQSALNEYTQKSRDEILDIINQHQVLQKQLIKESKDVELMDQIIDSNNYKKLFAPMLVDGYKFDENNVDGWMKFKNPDTDGANLSDIQKKYIRFYSNIVEKNVKSLFPGNYKLMYEDTDADVYSIKKWGKYNIPIIPGMKNLQIPELAGKAGLDNIIATFSKALSSSSRVATEKSQDVSTPWKYNSMFPSQVDTAQGRGSRQTRNLLNITDDNIVIEDKRNVEMNPITVLNLMTIEAARREYMKLAKFATFAVNAELVYKDLYPGVDTKILRSVINNAATIQIEGTTRGDSKFEKFLDTTKKVTQMGLFWMSGSQAVTEATTAITQITSQSISNLINKHMFKGDNRYDNKDMAWSTKHILSDLGNQIITDLGMYNSSLGEFTDSQYNETRKKLAWQTKHGFWFIHNTMKQGVQSIVLAQMHKEGITEACFKLDAISGRYKYDETADSRFYVYDKDNSKFQINKAPESPEEISKNEFWLAHREILAKEGGINEDGSMKRPFINDQLQTMKHYAIRLLGSMDSSETMAVEIGAVGRSLTTFKRWLRQKVTNYVGSSKDATYREGQWGVDENGKTTWTEEEFTGMFQAFGGIVKDLYNSGGDFKTVMENTSSAKKRQASKLMADLLLGASVMYIVGLLKDILGDSVIGKEVLRGITNASSDIFPVAAVKNTITGSPMPAVSIAANTVTSVYHAAGYYMTGDLDHALSATDQTFSSLGSYRSSKAFLSTIFDLEVAKHKKQ